MGCLADHALLAHLSDSNYAVTLTRTTNVSRIRVEYHLEL